MRELVAVLAGGLIAIPLYMLGERLRGTPAKAVKVVAFIAFWAILIAVMRGTEGVLP